MSLNNVTVTGQLPGAAGATAIFTRGGWLTDTIDDLLLPPVPAPVTLDGNGKFSISLLATDNAAPTPSGWTWTVNFVGVPGVAPYTFSFFLPFSGGASQDITSLAAVPAVTPMTQYLPLPTGTPTAGRVPVATGVGEASAWKSLVPPTFTTKSGAYVTGQLSTSTSATLGNASMRLVPFIVAQACTVTAIGTEFTLAGDAGSSFRMVLYADDGTAYPASLLLDGGSISTGTGNAGTVATGGTPGVYMNTGITPVTLQPGMYWSGGAIQGVTVTQPTMRTALWFPFVAAPNVMPAVASANVGYLQPSVTGTPPSTLNPWPNSASGSCCRIILKLA